MKEREKWKHYGQYSSNCFTLCVCEVVSVFNTHPFVHLLSDFTIRDHGMCMNCSTREEQSAEVSGPYPCNTPHTYLCLYTPLSHSHIPLSHTLQTLLFLVHTLLSLLHTHPSLTLHSFKHSLLAYWYHVHITYTPHRVV